MTNEQLEMQFISLVFTFHQSAMYALGKMPNPVTGQVERSLVQAQGAIDILEMILEKTKGNLVEKEEKFLKNTLQELRLNYVYEVEQDGKAKNTIEDKPDADSQVSQAGKTENEPDVKEAQDVSSAKEN